jgi:hypothetical protein
MSTDNCPNCNKSILNQTPSLIGTTKCNNPCPPEGVCDDQIPSNCVFYSGQNLSCSGIQNGDTLTTSLTKIESKLCLVQDKCYEWENVTFDLDGIIPNLGLYPPTGIVEEWENVTGLSVKYTKQPIGCRAGFQGSCDHKVTFEQGDVLTTNGARKTTCFSKLFSIPVAIIPSVNRSISVTVTVVPDPNNWPGASQVPIKVAGSLMVLTNGDVYVNFYDFSPWATIPFTCGECENMAQLEPYWFDIELGTSPDYLIATVSLDGVYYEL